MIAATGFARLMSTISKTASSVGDFIINVSEAVLDIKKGNKS